MNTPSNTPKKRGRQAQGILARPAAEIRDMGLDAFLEAVAGEPPRPEKLTAMRSVVVGSGKARHTRILLRRASVMALCAAFDARPRFDMISKQVELGLGAVDALVEKAFETSLTLDERYMLLIDTLHDFAVLTGSGEAAAGTVEGQRRDWQAMLTTIAATHAYNPAEDWLYDLPADYAAGGIGRLAGLVTLADESQRPVFEHALRLWLIQAVQAAAGWRSPRAVEYVLVLVSTDQGVGKTQFVANLAPPPLVAISVKLPGAGRGGHSSDALVEATGGWINEIGELSRSLVADQTEQKAFLSQVADRYRLPYGTGHITTPRTSVYIGTSDKIDIFKDRSGNRRFWPFVVERIDHEQVASLREDAWCEALDAWEAGESYVPVKDMTERISEIASFHDVGSLEEDQLVELLRPFLKTPRRAAMTWHKEHPDQWQPMNLKAVCTALQSRAGGDIHSTAYRQVVATWLDRNMHPRGYYNRPAEVPENAAPERMDKAWILPVTGLWGAGEQDLPGWYRMFLRTAPKSYGGGVE